jgi:hypothetical protein
MITELEWEASNRHVEWLKAQFISLHNTPQKDWTESQHEWARYLRKSCVETAEWRYWLCQINHQ